MRFPFFCTLFCLSAVSQAQQALPSCGPPPAILQSSAPNIFSEQQEQWLGDAMADYEEHTNKPIKDPALSAYLDTIRARLLTALPQTQLQFHFTLVESADVNGFSLAGGHVYLTRKLVASAHNEDEIAGVIAHEMGHILTHQFAIETTADLKRLLNVTSVGDRADIYAKYQRLVDAQMKDKHQNNPDSDDKQDQADRVAVYAAASAGYRPQAYAEFWDRSFYVGGKTGSRFTDFFGSTTPSQKRLRRIRGIIAELPAGCASTSSENASAAFKAWQHKVLENQAAGATPPAAAQPGTEQASVKGLDTAHPTSDVQLTPPLRLDIDRLRFSRDGKYILAQDGSSIFVLSREPFKQLFRFDAEDAVDAEFTPDSRQIVFRTRDLHIERWSVAEGKLVAAHELNPKQDCVQKDLSPDGRTVFCFSQSTDGSDLVLSLIDVESGNTVFEKKPWFHFDFGFYLMLLRRRYNGDQSDFVQLAYSGDGQTVLLGSASDKLAFDLRTRSQIALGGPIKDSSIWSSYCFQGNDKIVVVNNFDFATSGVFSFPDGHRLDKFKLGLRWMESTTGGNFIKGPPPDGFLAAVINPKASTFVAASKSPALDIIDNTVVSENSDGSLLLSQPNTQDPKSRSNASLTLSPFARTQTISLSPDGRYLAVSARTRGSIWDLKSGKQAFLVRGFNGAWWTPEGKFIAEFPENGKAKPLAVGEIGLNSHSAKNLSYKVPENAALRSGHLLEWKSEKQKAWTLTAYSPLDLSVAWTRRFADASPGYTTNDGDTDLIFSDLLQSPLAKETLRGNPKLQAQADALKTKKAGRLIEVVSSTDGKTRAQVVVEVPLTYVGVGGFDRVGDLLYLSTGDRRSIVYSLSSGAQLRQMFGIVVAVDQESESICTQNRRNELTILDKNGAELQHLDLGTPVRYVVIREHGTELFVLTADQRVRRFPIAKPASTVATQ